MFDLQGGCCQQMNVNEVCRHTDLEDLLKKVVIEKTDREERRKRSIRCTLL